ncbi:hypothetical protein [Acanthopleuribacter pedis]|uniref:Cell division protein FtsL n=1 Tax=Acanthopleuribacter pedis TaxID=442870 RepID=A0A8J7U3X0_9BACT|nr:hypothetical protein [Acanthopleuribacter pedis]MBO1318748.1 hypothetical protein [Acanthopleuribacter pedis]
MSKASQDSIPFARADRKVAPTRRRSWQILQFTAAMLLLVCCMMFVVYKRSNVVDLGYSISELRRENAELKQEQIRLLGEKARLERPGRILKKALDMGLRPVPAGQRFEVVFLNQPSAPRPEPSPEELDQLVAKIETEP